MELLLLLAFTELLSVSISFLFDNLGRFDDFWVVGEVGLVCFGGEVTRFCDVVLATWGAEITSLPCPLAVGRRVRGRLGGLGEGSGFTFPKAEGTASGWLHRATITTISWQWKDNRSVPSGSIMDKMMQKQVIFLALIPY
ncbi:hypothetical protein D8674_002956 [Pyrus ussuriensis x Pyrus communis]|uniref:Uncharacterized protein n=1 Tax=Pyrus ussuriensis x Pyrus communis TaxID=2448454 RepID=A0A5N5FJS0_9ROSA|nr:hypothetical protein D8674_002956 [Pyrus ussuriensis x Pyrus communis]